MPDPMPSEDEQRIRELLDMHPALLQSEAIELRRHLLDAREDLAAVRAELADEKRRNHYVRAGNAERENARLRAELAETTHALEVTGEKAEALRGQRDRAEAERNTALAELNGAYRGAEELRSMLRDRTAERDQARAELAKRPKSRLGEQVNRLSNAVGDLERERDAARAERDEAREQVTRVREVVASTSWEHALVKARDIRRALDGTEDRP